MNLGTGKPGTVELGTGNPGALRRRVPVTLLGALTSCVLLSSAGGPPVVEASGLTPTSGGVLLTATFKPRGRDALSGVWYGGGRAKLLQCEAHCTVIKEIPFDSPLMVSQDSMYRVVLAGKFRPGQRLKMVMRFADLQLVTLSVPVVE